MVEFILACSNLQRRNQFESYWHQYQESYHNDGLLDILNEEKLFSESHSLFGDVLLIDLSFDGEKMFALAEEFRRLNPDSIIILMSDDTDYALQGYSISAFRYLIHPIAYSTFKEGLNDTFEKLMKPNPSYVFIPLANRLKKVFLNDIYFIRPTKKCVIYETRFGTYEAYQDINFRAYQKLGFANYEGSSLINLNNLDHIEQIHKFISENQISVSVSKN